MVDERVQKKEKMTNACPRSVSMFSRELGIGICTMNKIDLFYLVYDFLCVVLIVANCLLFSILYN